METATLPAVQETQEDKDLKFVESGIALFNQAPGILRDNKTRVDRALIAAQDFLNRYAENNYQFTPEMDAEAMELLVKINKTATLIKGQREPVTQIFDAVKKLFTGMESKLSLKDIGMLPAQVQKARDDYAKWCVEEDARKEKERQEKAAKENEKAELKAWITQKIGELLAAYVANKKTLWTNSFNAITLADYEEKAAKVRSVSTVFNKEKLQEIVKISSRPHTPRLNDMDRIVIEKASNDEYDFNTWIATHNAQFEELKRSLVDRLPSKKQELEEAAAAEAACIKADQEAAEAEAKRKAELAAAGEAERKALEEKQSQERIVEMELKKKLEEEQARIAEEKKQREDAEAAKIKADREEAARKSAELAEANKSASVAANLFESTLSVADAAPAPETRQGFNIVVTNPAGYAEMVSMWFSREGMKMGTDELEKVSFGKIKTYWEAVAKKTGEKISSKFLKYDIAVKAINRKEK